MRSMRSLRAKVEPQIAVYASKISSLIARIMPQIKGTSRPLSHIHRVHCISNSDDAATAAAPSQSSQSPSHILSTTHSISSCHRPGFKPSHLFTNYIPSRKTDSTEQHHNTRTHNPCHQRWRDLLLPPWTVGSPLLTSRIPVTPIL